MKTRLGLPLRRFGALRIIGNCRCSCRVGFSSSVLFGERKGEDLFSRSQTEALNRKGLFSNSLRRRLAPHSLSFFSSPSSSFSCFSSSSGSKDSFLPVCALFRRPDSVDLGFQKLQNLPVPSFKGSDLSALMNALNQDDSSLLVANLGRLLERISSRIPTFFESGYLVSTVNCHLFLKMLEDVNHLGSTDITRVLIHGGFVARAIDFFAQNPAPTSASVLLILKSLGEVPVEHQTLVIKAVNLLLGPLSKNQPLDVRHMNMALHALSMCKAVKEADALFEKLHSGALLLENQKKIPPGGFIEEEFELRATARTFCTMINLQARSRTVNTKRAIDLYKSFQRAFPGSPNFAVDYAFFSTLCRAKAVLLAHQQFTHLKTLTLADTPSYRMSPAIVGALLRLCQQQRQVERCLLVGTEMINKRAQFKLKLTAVELVPYLHCLNQKKRYGETLAVCNKLLRIENHNEASLCLHAEALRLMFPKARTSLARKARTLIDYCLDKYPIPVTAYVATQRMTVSQSPRDAVKWLQKYNGNKLKFQPRGLEEEKNEEEEEEEEEEDEEEEEEKEEKKAEDWRKFPLLGNPIVMTEFIKVCTIQREVNLARQAFEMVENPTDVTFGAQFHNLAQAPGEIINHPRKLIVLQEYFKHLTLLFNKKLMKPNEIVCDAWQKAQNNLCTKLKPLNEIS